MKLHDVTEYFRTLFSIEEVKKIDASMNGLQVTRMNPEIRKVAFAVDACLESFKRAADRGADMLFVHHGLFWGDPIALAGKHYYRIKTLLDNDLALYAVHLPLDMHPEIGNNAGIASALELHNVEEFGNYKGLPIGIKGELEEALTLDKIVNMLFGPSNNKHSVLPFGPEKIRKLGIVSGGAPYEVLDAIDQKLDLYITGESSHTIYHWCLEEKMNVVFGGHYQTEIYGVKLALEKVERDLGLETEFIDIPTGL